MRLKHGSLLYSVVAIAVCVWTAIAQQPGMATPKERKPSPSLEVQTIDGKVLKVDQMHGSVVLLDFMTTVCPTCKLASSGLQKVYQELGPKGFRPVAVALNVDSAAPLQDYIREHGLTFTFGTVPRDDVGPHLSHPADRPLRVPTVVLLDRRGRVCSVEIGWSGEDAVRAQVLKLLAE